jgi:dipeptidyl aminopeptidase/acylaminoacyl peptidase
MIPATRPRLRWLALLAILVGLLPASRGEAAAVKLNPPPVAGGQVSHFRISPSGGRVVYVADQEVDEVRELYRVPLVGGMVIKLNSPLVAGGDVHDFQIGPDGGQVVYRADQEQDDTFELYRAPLLGGMATKLSPPPVAGGEAGFPTVPSFSPDGRRLVFLADPEADGRRELYAATAIPYPLYLPLLRR